MAKVKAPLFSFEARGKLADSIVYFPWKGVNAVRSYVIPADPVTAAKTAQRARMTAAVAEWHGASYSALDIGAWNRLANLLATSLSGFNRMVQEHIDEAILGSTWERMADVDIYGVTAILFSVRVAKASTGNAPTLRWGTSPTNMPNALTMSDETGDIWQRDVGGLTASTLYYFTIDVGATATDWGRTGIYTQRTIA